MVTPTRENYHVSLEINQPPDDVEYIHEDDRLCITLRDGQKKVLLLRAKLVEESIKVCYDRGTQAITITAELGKGVATPAESCEPCRHPTVDNVETAVVTDRTTAVVAEPSPEGPADQLGLLGSQKNNAEKAATDKAATADQVDQVTAMGRSMVENLRESGAESDALAMEKMLRQMEAAVAGNLGADGMKNLDETLDDVLAHASEGLPPDVVRQIKDKVPQKWSANHMEPQLRRASKPPTRLPEPTLPPVEHANVKKEEGNAEYKKKRYAAAVNRYTEAIGLKPDFASCFSNRSLVHYCMGSYELAVQDAQACVRIDPNFIKGYMRLAAAQLELKQYDAARATVRAGMAKQLDEPELTKLLREIKEREWDMELGRCETQEDRLELERCGVHQMQARRVREEAEQDVASHDSEEVEDVITPGAEIAMAAEKAQSARLRKGTTAKEAKKKTDTPREVFDRTPQESVKPPVGAQIPKAAKHVDMQSLQPSACVKGLTEAKDEFKAEMLSVWSCRNEVFQQVWSSEEMMQKLGGRLQSLASVISNISNYPDKPFGLQIDQETFFALIPELSPPAVQAYCREPGRFYALVKELVTKDWHKDADELRRNTKVFNGVVEIGAYTVPFDEARPVSPADAAALDFGSRLKLFGNLRCLFMCQSVYLIMSILLAQAIEKKLIGVQ